MISKLIFYYSTGLAAITNQLNLLYLSRSLVIYLFVIHLLSRNANYATAPRRNGNQY